MRQIKLIVAALLVTAPFAANAIPVSYDFFGTADGGWTFEASFIIDDADLIAGDILPFLDSWSASWTNGTEFYELTSATSSFLGSYIIVGSDFSLLDASLCTNPCSAGSVTFQLFYFDGSFRWDGTYGEDLLEIVSGVAEASEPDFTSVPEPGTLALLGIGLFGMGLARRRKAA